MLDRDSDNAEPLNSAPSRLGLETQMGRRICLFRVFRFLVFILTIVKRWFNDGQNLCRFLGL